MTNEVLDSALYAVTHAQDVTIKEEGIRSSAAFIHMSMREKAYSQETWSSHALHPKTKSKETLYFIFFLDLMNFSFWSDSEKFTVRYGGQLWTGYWSLCALIHRAKDENFPLLDPPWWGVASDLDLRHCFRGETTCQIPLLHERIQILRESSALLASHYDGSVERLIECAEYSARRLVCQLVSIFPSFRDSHQYHGRTIKLYKRAQILVADLWACFGGSSYGKFDDIDEITMFADYRVPQILHGLDCLAYSDRLLHTLRNGIEIACGSDEEIEVRACSIWAVELICREIRLISRTAFNAILVDFYLWDLAKAREKEGAISIPCHKTRCIFY